MDETRPTTAVILGLVGGAFILIAGIAFTVLSLVLGSLFGAPFAFPFGLFAVLGLAFGVVVVVGAVLMYLRPAQHVTWGAVVLAFSAASVVNFGGFIVGLVLGIVGGALGVAWRPGGGPRAVPFAPYGVAVTPWRMCMGCGRWIPWAFNVCPFCGTRAPVASWTPPMPGSPAPTPSPSPSPAAPPTQASVRAPCPTCAGWAEWVPAHERWYCPTESRYF